MKFRCGTVCLLGKPNVGKSALLNALVGNKVAIVTPKPQTTRVHLRGILTRENAQIVFVDTPGAHTPGSRLNRAMMKAVEEGLEGVDLFYLVVDTSRLPGKEDGIALALGERSRAPGFLVLNKIDLIRPSKLLPLIDHYRQRYDFAGYLPVSARTGENLRLLEEKTIEQLPEGAPFFPPDEFTDQPVRFLAAEIIREQLFLETRQEIPYGTTVLIDRYEDGEGLLRICATILVDRPGQKGIVIGKKGQMLKKIGQRARENLEKLLGRRAYLELFVKVKQDWHESSAVRSLIDWRSG